MPDIVEIAKRRRNELAKELSKLDEFIQMAEKLIKWHESKTTGAPTADQSSVKGSSEPVALRTGSATGST